MPTGVKNPRTPRADVSSLMRSMMRRVRDRSLEGVASVAPALAAYADWCQPVHNRWVGPMNGQPARQQLVRDIARCAQPKAVIETGTNRGVTTEFLWSVTGAPTWTVETSQRFAKFAQWRLHHLADITVCHDDSRAFLAQLARDEQMPKEDVLFYLDAHWGTQLPLREELVTIAQHWTEPVILIDDFQVPGDTGYGFDDYGNGMRLSSDYVPLAEMGDFTLLFPACPSAAEGGSRRGCVVIVSPTRADEFKGQGLPLVRCRCDEARTA
jgi:predicted O-methyltransferase YrrM